MAGALSIDRLPNGQRFVTRRAFSRPIPAVFSGWVKLGIRMAHASRPGQRIGRAGSRSSTVGYSGYFRLKAASGIPARGPGSANAPAAVIQSMRNVRLQFAKPGKSGFFAFYSALTVRPGNANIFGTGARSQVADSERKFLSRGELRMDTFFPKKNFSLKKVERWKYN